MTIALESTGDKNIVDRSRPQRNAGVSQAVRATRERLQFRQPLSHHFAREMMLLHINSLLQGAAAMPLLVLAATGISIYFGESFELIPWSALTLAAYAILVFLARRASAKSFDPATTRKWTIRFLVAHLTIGLCWAIFAYQDCATCSGPSFSFYKGVILLVALAASAMATFTLKRAIIASFGPPVIAFGLSAYLHGSPYDLGMAAVLGAAFCYFVFISNRLYVSNLTLLSFQSEKVALIAELEVANAVSDEARRRAEEANLAKSRFLASMSHELRTPLNAILGFSEVMSQEVLGPMPNPTYKDYAADIHRSGEHLLNLINEILDLSRIEAGRYDLTEEALSLVEIAEDCIGMVQLKARSKHIDIRAQVEPSLPLVWVDERAMRQVVLNLLSNAVKFTPQNGIVTVKVGWTAGGGQYLSVVDDGPGIPEEEIPIVLSAFGQGSVAIKSAEQGTGLGLPIVQAILAKHGGQFVLRSKLREGTEAIAILPPRRVLQSIPPIDDDSIYTTKQKKPVFA
ncbi:sensor histidine kinase [Georhizobium sp. MAB10]|uniref:sensor histidine kinase n=1 Tax=Georhizobium sp. MAB10 TaxID=3028319 RepID=UPI00385575E0